MFSDTQMQVEVTRLLEPQLFEPRQYGKSSAKEMGCFKGWETTPDAETVAWFEMSGLEREIVREKRNKEFINKLP